MYAYVADAVLWLTREKKGVASASVHALHGIRHAHPRNLLCTRNIRTICTVHTERKEGRQMHLDLLYLGFGNFDLGFRLRMPMRVAVINPVLR